MSQTLPNVKPERENWIWVKVTNDVCSNSIRFINSNIFPYVNNDISKESFKGNMYYIEQGVVRNGLYV